jgi:hypothetical protein
MAITTILFHEIAVALELVGDEGRTSSAAPSGHRPAFFGANAIKPGTAAGPLALGP